MLDEEAPQELEAVLILAEEHNIVLVSLLKGLDRLGIDRLHHLHCSMELLVLLKG